MNTPSSNTKTTKTTTRCLPLANITPTLPESDDSGRVSFCLHHRQVNSLEENTMSGVITEPTVVNCKQCGQETVIEFYPNQTEKSKRARAKKALCFECYKKQKAGGAAEYNRRRGYSSLKGSPKQIDWAESLRKIHIFRIVNHLEVIGQKEFAKRAEKYLGSKTSAKWWVEHSEYPSVEKHIEELIHNATNKVS